RSYQSLNSSAATLVKSIAAINAPFAMAVSPPLDPRDDADSAAATSHAVLIARDSIAGETGRARPTPYAAQATGNSHAFPARIPVMWPPDTPPPPNRLA